MTTATLTLTDFLLARIAEDEGAATELRDQYPHDGGPSHLSGNWDIVQVTTGYDRVLAECEAKRRIVEEVRDSEILSDEGTNGFVLARSVLRLLATPYADHPDCREEWKP